VSHLTKTETSLVIWLNVVTIVARSVRLLLAHIREDAHATRHYCIDNDGLVNAMPNMQQTMLQFINFVHPRLIDLLLDDAPYLVGIVDRAEVRTVLWPQILWKESRQILQWQICQYSNFWLSQGSGATHWRFGGKYYTCFVGNLVLFPAVKELNEFVKN